MRTVLLLNRAAFLHGHSGDHGLAYVFDRGWVLASLTNVPDHAARLAESGEVDVVVALSMPSLGVQRRLAAVGVGLELAR